MSCVSRPAVALLLALACLPGRARAEERKPNQKPAHSRRQVDRLEALTLYGLAVRYEKQNRLLEATRTYEKALQLDPESAEIRKALVPLYMALDRQEDALAACKKALEIDDRDFTTWYLHARQLQALDRPKEARQALIRAAACPGLADRPEAQLSILHDLGELHEKFGDLGKAEAAFRQVAAILDKPGMSLRPSGSGEEVPEQVAELLERVGRLCLKQNQPARAIAAFEQARKKDSNRAVRLAFHLAEVHAQQKNWKEALACIDDYLARQPPGTEGYELKIRILRQAGQADRIVPALEAHARRDHFNNALQLLLAREYQAAGKMSEAEQAYQRVIKAAPSPEAYRGLFSLIRNNRGGPDWIVSRLDQAITAANPEDEGKQASSSEAIHVRAMLAVIREDRELAKQLLPVGLNRILRGPSPSYQLRLILAALAERTGELAAAENFYRRCMDRQGKVFPIPNRRGVEVEVYSGLLQVLRLAHKNREVIELCQQGLKHSEVTNHVMFYRQLAYAYLALEKDEEALKAITDAVDRATERNRVFCRCDRLYILAQVGRYADAVKEGEALLAEVTDPRDRKTVRFALSSVHSLHDALDKSEELLQAILKEDPDDVRANNDLGYHWADRNKNLDEAERMIRKALELDARQRKNDENIGLDAGLEKAAYVDSLGWVLFRKGKLKESREQLEKAATLPDGVDDPVLWDHLGDVCAKMKDLEQARQAWRKALKLYDEGKRRKTDDRYKDIEHKLKQTEAARQR